MKYNPKTHITGKVYDLTQDNMNAMISEIERTVDHKMSAVILAEQNEKLQKQYKILKEIVKHIAETDMPQLGDYGFDGEELDRHYENVCAEALTEVQKPQ